MDEPAGPRKGTHDWFQEPPPAPSLPESGRVLKDVEADMMQAIREQEEEDANLANQMKQAPIPTPMPPQVAQPHRAPPPNRRTRPPLVIPPAQPIPIQHPAAPVAGPPVPIQTPGPHSNPGGPFMSKGPKLVPPEPRVLRDAIWDVLSNAGFDHHTILHVTAGQPPQLKSFGLDVLVQAIIVGIVKGFER
jgi:hypothetical protein